MNNPLRNPILYLAVLSIFFTSCQSNQDKTDLNEKPVSDQKEKILNPEEEEIIAAVEKLLVAAGNYNIEVLDEMVSDKAMIAYSFLSNGIWTNREITIAEYFEDVKKREFKPYCELVSNYDIIITEGRLALARADAIVHRLGVPGKREINHMTLMKEGENWKFLNISWTAHELPEEKKKFDLNIFARSYAQVWCSQRPEFVSLFFADDGSLTVNNGKPAIGRDEISKVAESFMTAFPDIIVTIDSLVTTSEVTEFHWTFTGTNTGPNGTGKKVKISGVELWQLDDNGLIKESNGSFDTEEYERQIKFGAEK